jgi:hypothetical protein
MADTLEVAKIVEVHPPVVIAGEALREPHRAGVRVE